MIDRAVEEELTVEWVRKVTGLVRFLRTSEATKQCLNLLYYFREPGCRVPRSPRPYRKIGDQKTECGPSPHAIGPGGEESQGVIPINFTELNLKRVPGIMN